MKPITKLFSPAVYAGFLIPTELAIIISVFASRVSYLFGLHGWVEVLLGIVTVGSLIFWFANKVLTKLEISSRPAISDHYRQSAACYVVALWTFIILYANGGYHGGLGEAIFILVPLLIAVWAIIINAIYIFWHCRTTPVTTPPVVSYDGVKNPTAKIAWPIFIGPALILLLMVAGYYARQMHYRIEYLRMNPPPRVASPNDPPPPADLQSLSGKMSSSTTIDTSGLPSPSPDSASFTTYTEQLVD